MIRRHEINFLKEEIRVLKNKTEALEMVDTAKTNKVIQLKTELEDLQLYVDKAKLDMQRGVAEHRIEAGNLGNLVEKRLVDFHKEITDKFFNTLEKIFQSFSQISVVQALAHKVDEQDLASLKRNFMAPLIEQKKKLAEAEESGKVDNTLKTQGATLVQKRRELHDRRIELEREEQPTSDLEEQIKALDWVIGGCK